MLRLTLEIVPFGIESQKQTIDAIEIFNTGENEQRPDLGDYNAVRGGKLIGQVKNHDRSDGALKLVRDMFESILSEKIVDITLA